MPDRASQERQQHATWVIAEVLVLHVQDSVLAADGLPDTTWAWVGAENTFTRVRPTTAPGGRRTLGRQHFSRGMKPHLMTTATATALLGEVSALRAQPPAPVTPVTRSEFLKPVLPPGNSRNIQAVVVELASAVARADSLASCQSTDPPMLRLNKVSIDALLRSTESGMEFQAVDVTTASDSTRAAVVYNAELLLFEEEPRADLKRASFEFLLQSARSTVGEIRVIRVVDRRPRPSAVREAREDSRNGEAKDVPVEATGAADAFKRFSAYAKDRRVTDDKRLLPGTYATTEADAARVHSPSEAVARYALPNPQPASWVFTSTPHTGTSIQRGTVAPAFGQPDGGVEVIFPAGTQPNTTTGPIKIPD